MAGGLPLAHTMELGMHGSVYQPPTPQQLLQINPANHCDSGFPPQDNLTCLRNGTHGMTLLNARRLHQATNAMAHAGLKPTKKVVWMNT
jgi:hypothetical protein